MILFDEKHTKLNLQDSVALDYLENKLSNPNGSKWICAGNYKFVFTRLSKNTFDFGFEIRNINSGGEGYDLNNIIIDHFFYMDLKDFFFTFTRLLRFKIDFTVAEIDRIQKAIKKLIGEYEYTMSFPLSWMEEN